MVETYFVTDVEADGPIPGPYSMLSLATVACDAAGRTLGEFSMNLDPLPGASTHPTVMKFWAQQPEAWAACHVDTQSAVDGTRAFGQWIRRFPGRLVLAAWTEGLPHTYIALDDAREQAALFCALTLRLRHRLTYGSDTHSTRSGVS